MSTSSSILLRSLPTTALLALLVACGSGDSTSSDSGADAGSPDTGAGEDVSAPDTTADTAAPDTADDEDVATIGDVSAPPDVDDNACPQDDLVDAWPLIDEFALGSATTEADGDAFVSTIDAAAGGSQASRNNAFVYFDFVSGEPQLLTDLESLIDENWTLGFRRTNIRLNSGDSGPGAWEMTRISDTTFADVTAAPGNDANWEIDATFEADCDVRLDPINNPFTAIHYLNVLNPSGSSSWYDYGGDAGVTPVAGHVYVVRNTATDAAFKFAIEDWQDGVYTLRWAEL